MKTQFEPSELILNDDGSVFHLHLLPSQLAEKIILVGDPDRVSMVSSFFTSIECEVRNREFHTITGQYKGKRISVVSTGIGCDNIDIVLNELDALTNIDLSLRQVKPNLRSLEIVRVGTCGGLQPNTPEGTFIVSQKSIGFDGLLNFYAGRNSVCDLKAEEAFLDHMKWTGCQCIAHPYVIDANSDLVEKISQGSMVHGITVACGGFYGPQGRELRLPLADPKQNEKIESFTYQGLHITNFEMESSAVAGLSKLLGHKAMTCCLVIANRVAHKALVDYHARMKELVELVLDRI